MPNYYLEKVTFAVTASSSKSWATASSTKSYSGFIAGLYLSPDASNPLTAGSSSYFQLRADTTAGRVICRSSSGSIGTRYWYPRHRAHCSTSGAAIGSSIYSQLPVCNEKLVLIKIAGATSGGGGSTEGMNLVCFVEGVHP